MPDPLSPLSIYTTRVSWLTCGKLLQQQVGTNGSSLNTFNWISTTHRVYSATPLRSHLTMQYSIFHLLVWTYNKPLMVGRKHDVSVMDLYTVWSRQSPWRNIRQLRQPNQRPTVICRRLSWKPSHLRRWCLQRFCQSSTTKARLLHPSWQSLCQLIRILIGQPVSRLYHHLLVHVSSLPEVS